MARKRPTPSRNLLPDHLVTPGERLARQEKRDAEVAARKQMNVGKSKAARQKAVDEFNAKEAARFKAPESSSDNAVDLSANGKLTPQAQKTHDSLQRVAKRAELHQKAVADRKKAGGTSKSTSEGRHKSGSGPVGMGTGDRYTRNPKTGELVKNKARKPKSSKKPKVPSKNNFLSEGPKTSSVPPDQFYANLRHSYHNTNWKNQRRDPKTGKFA